MRKLLLVLEIGLALIIMCSCKTNKTDSGDVAAVVYGEEISRSSVEQEQKQLEEAYKKAIDLINSKNLSDSQKKAEIEKIALPRSFSEILNEKIKARVLYHEAEKKGLTDSISNACQEVLKAYDGLSSSNESDKSGELGKKAAEIAEEYIKGDGRNTEDYIKDVLGSYNEKQVIDKLKESFSDESGEKTNGGSFEKKFEEYTEKLVKDADVKYFD